MAESLLKVGGVNDTKLATPLALSENGHLRTNQFPATSFYLGDLKEPTADGHVGAYGIFGIEVLRDDYKGAIFASRYQSGVLAKLGRYYFVTCETIPGGLNVWLTMVNTLTQERKTIVEDSYPPTTGGANYPLTIIDLGANIAVVNQLGVGTLYNANTLAKVGTLAWDALAYNKNSKQLTNNSSSHPNIQYRDANGTTTAVLSAHRITEYNQDGTRNRYADVSTILGDANAYFSAIRNFDANSKYFFITANISDSTTGNGWSIIIVKRSDFSLVKIIQSTAEIPRQVMPIAIASAQDEKFYTVEVSSGDIFAWSISGNVVTYDDVAIGSLGFTTNIASIFAIRKNGLTLMRTVNGIYLYDFDSAKLMWSLQIPTVGQNGTAHFDGFGHILFGGVDNNLMLVSQYLQLQGYGVNV